MHGIPKRYEDASWSNWVPRPELAEAIATLQRWEGEPWAILLLSGPRSNLGTGKSRALCSTVSAWRAGNKRAFYLPVTRIVQIEHAIMDEGSADEKGTAGWCCETPAMLAFDDLGAEHNSDWSVGLAERIADERYANILPSIFATNLDERALQARYPRLWRRCTEGLMVPWAAPLFGEHPEALHNAPNAATRRGPQRLQ
jgi:hypothetical protein